MLTEKQRNAIDLYYNDDLSLAEIAQAADISRQGVRDNIKRAEQILTELEEKLGLAKRFSDMKQGFAEIIRAADSIEKISENLPQEYKANIKNYTKIIPIKINRIPPSINPVMPNSIPKSFSSFLSNFLSKKSTILTIFIV